MITCTSASAVAVLEAHEVVELRRGSLENVTVHYCLDLVDELRRNVNRLTRLEGTGDEGIARLGPQGELAREKVHRLVFPVVILETEHVSRLHVEDLPHITIGESPDQLVAPRLLYPVRHVGHSALHVGEVERRWSRDAGVNADTTADAALATENRMSGFIDSERRFTYR